MSQNDQEQEHNQLLSSQNKNQAIERSAKQEKVYVFIEFAFFKFNPQLLIN